MSTLILKPTKILVKNQTTQVRQLIITIAQNLFHKVEITQLAQSSFPDEFINIKFHFIFCEPEDKSKDFKRLLNKEGIIYYLNKNENDKSEESETVNKPFDFNLYIPTPIDMTKIINQITESLSLTKLTNHLDDKSRFKSVKTTYFLRFNKSEFDIYIRIGEDRFIKFINKNEFYEREQINKYKNKKVTSLYVEKEDYDKLGRTLSLAPFLKMKRPEGIDPKEYLRGQTTRARELCKEMVNAIGFDPKITEMANTYVGGVEEHARKYPLLFNELQKLKNKDEYLIDHSFMTGIIATHITNVLGQQYKINNKKIVMAALFHDILLENSKLAEIETKSDPRCKMFSKSELDEYFLHPNKTAKFIQKAKIFPEDVSRIILEHHENGNGNGFPHNKRASNISTLSAIFIVSHNFVDWLYRGMFDELETKHAMAALKSKYTDGFYINAFSALEKVLKIESDNDLY